MVDIIALSEPQNHRCCYCGHEMIRHTHVDGESTPRNAMTKDHVEPRTYGGETTWLNMVAACCQCNNLRGELDAESFYNLIGKWFRRDKSLWMRWHDISREELFNFKVQVVSVHAKRLQGLAKRDIEFAFRHFDFAFRKYRRYPIKA